MIDMALIERATEIAKRSPHWGGTPSEASRLTIERVKRMAKRRRQEGLDLSHTQALDCVARDLGFGSYAHAKSQLDLAALDRTLANYAGGD